MKRLPDPPLVNDVPLTPVIDQALLDGLGMAWIGLALLVLLVLLWRPFLFRHLERRSARRLEGRRGVAM